MFVVRTILAYTLPQIGLPALSSGCVEDIAVENAEASRVTIMAPVKTASLPRNTQPQWPTLQGGSIVSDYLTNLDIVSLTSSDSFRFIFLPKCRAW